MQTADVVIIGAGVNGTSTALHLARAGVKNIKVVERKHLAAGASGKSGALVRTHYTNKPETELAAYSLNVFHNWADAIGGDCGFERAGLLVLTPPDKEKELRANVAMHQSLGATAQVISAADALELDPSLYVDDLSYLAYEPDSGYVDANTTVHSLAAAAQDAGVEFLFGTEVLSIHEDNGRVTGVQTSQGEISTHTAVVIAGAWANQLFAPLDIKLEVVPRAVRVAVFSWAYGRASTCPSRIDHINNTWARPIDGNCTLIGSEWASDTEVLDPNNYSEAVDQAYINLCRDKLVNRVPIMQHSNARGNWTCALMQSADARPIIDKLELAGLYTMTGDSGTSFKTAPAIGKALSEWIVDGQVTSFDMHPFRASRFAEGKPWVDENDYDGFAASGLQETRTVSR
jgi:sarcosine oxidase subunit beta